MPTMRPMAPKLLTSAQNPLLKRFRAAARDHRGEVFLVEGRHLIGEAINARWPIEAVLVDPAYWNTWRPLLQDAVPEKAVYLVPHDLIRTLGTVHSPEGVLALARRRDGEWPSPAAGHLYLFLDAVQDPVNTGILIRSARAFGLTAVFAGAGSVDPFHPTALSRSAGATLHMPVLPCTPDAFLSWVTENGVLLMGADSRGKPVEDCEKPAGAAAIAVGNEGRGLSIPVRDACALRLGIPMAHGWDSLNVAVAGGLLMYHFSRLGRAGT